MVEQELAEQTFIVKRKTKPPQINCGGLINQKTDPPWILDLLPRMTERKT